MTREHCKTLDIIRLHEYNNSTGQRCPKENMVRPPLAAIQMNGSINIACPPLAAIQMNGSKMCGSPIER